MSRYSIRARNNRWQARWYDDSGLRCSQMFDTRTAAKKYLDRVSADRQRGTYRDPVLGRATFREIAEAWLASKANLKARTRAGYAAALAPGQSIDLAFGGLPIEAVTRQRIADWVEATASGKAASTVRNRFFVVRQICQQAYIDGRIPANPCVAVTLPKARNVADDSTRLFLTAEQLNRLAAEMPSPYDVLVLFAGWTGLRAGEIAGLQVADLDLSRPGRERVQVRRTIVDVNGHLSYDTPKSRRSRRTVPLPQNLLLHLRDYVSSHPRRDVPTAPLFPGKTGHGNRSALDWDKPLRHGAFYGKTFKPAVLRAELPADLRFHDLRHTYASLCVSRGLTVKEISSFMGHATIATTMDIYTHLYEDDHSAAMAKLDTAWPVGRSAAQDNVIPLRRA